MTKAKLKGPTSLTPVNKPDKGDPLKQDFRKFLYVIWKHLGLGEPTPLQYDMAWSLQHGGDREMIQAFRGAAKSWIAVAFILWLFYCDPQRKVLVVSAAEPLAKDITTFCLQLIRDVPILRHLAPRRDQRQSSLSFDVGPARPSKDASLTARGITGQITGTRAHFILADDVEIPRNSMTVTQRQLLKERVKEFDAIILPGGRVRFLGTPQSHDSMYKSLPEKGYTVRIWPALVPSEKEARSYGASLAPFIRRLMEKRKAGSPVEPTRFTEEDLAKRRKSWGLDGFRLQFMLDTSLSDEDKFPLKLRDLIVLGAIDRARGPDHVIYACEARTEQQELPLVGMDRDRYFGPALVSESYSPWPEIIMLVDPSGRGKDDTAYAILAELHGFIYLLAVGGFGGGYDVTTLTAIAAKCVEWKVNLCRCEDNFGDGMFTTLLAPHVAKAWEGHFKGRKPKGDEIAGTKVEGFKVGQVQKETRIVAKLAPVLQSHRLVTSRDVIMMDYTECEKREGDDWLTYSAFYQLSHLTRDRGSLAHDDKLDCIAEGVAYFTVQLGINPEEAATDAENDRVAQELEKLFGGEDIPGERRPADIGNTCRGQGLGLAVRH